MSEVRIVEVRAAEELEQAFAIRRAVFVREQGVSERWRSTSATTRRVISWRSAPASPSGRSACAGWSAGASPRSSGSR
jgi:hypothetical protein